MDENQLDRSQDPNDTAAEYRSLRQQQDSLPPDSWEYQQTRSAADATYTRFVGDLHQFTKCQKPSQPSYNLSSGQIDQARTEAKASLDRKIYQTVLKGDGTEDICHYYAKVNKYELLTACLKEAKGKKRTSTLNPTKKEVYFPEISGDVPIDPQNPDSPTIIDCAADERSDDVDRNLLLIDLEDLCAGITMRSRPDISLLECCRLILNDYTIMDIARHFAPDLPKLRLRQFYDRLDYWLKSEAVKSLLEERLHNIVLLYLFIMVDFLDF